MISGTLGTQTHTRTPQEADVNGDGTLDVEEFLAVFDKLFGLEGKVGGAVTMVTQCLVHSVVK